MPISLLGGRVLGRIVHLLLTVAVFVAGTILTIRHSVYALTSNRHQWRTLRRILRQNAATVFGQAHRFSEIRNYEDFVGVVPVRDFEGFRPYIRQSIETGTSLLSIASIDFVTTTSGTTGSPKVLLQSKQLYRREYLRYTIAALFYALCARPGLLMRKVAVIVSRDDETNIQHLSRRAGADHAYQTSPFSAILAIPSTVFSIKNYDARYYYINLFSILEEVHLVITPNPLTVITLLRVAQLHQSRLAHDLAARNIENYFGLDPEIFHKLSDAYQRAASNRRPRSGPPLLSGDSGHNNLYRHLQGVMCWTKGNCAAYIPQLRDHILPSARIFELGYLASDSPMAIHIGCGGDQVAILDAVFLEFAPYPAHETMRQGPIPYTEVEVGRRYKIIVTNAYGLYRYDMLDVVEIVDRRGGLPVFQFVQKVDGFSSIVGEKLSEYQVIECMSLLARDTGVGLAFFICLPAIQDQRYEFFIEFSDGRRADDVGPVEQAIDEILQSLNVEYAGKRRSGRLLEPKVHRLTTNSYERYKRHFVELGAKDAQFKILALRGDAGHRPILKELSL